MPSSQTLVEYSLSTGTDGALPPAPATPVISSTMVTTESGGLLQSSVHIQMDSCWETTPTASSFCTENTTIGTTACLLVASGINY